MKKYLIILILLLCIPGIVYGASASGSLAQSASTGDTVKFTVNLSATAAWNIRMTGIGATSNCSASYADVTANGKNTNQALTLSCKATTEGSITFTATGDITSEDGKNSNVSITKVITINKPRAKESEARLSSLTIKDYKIDFNKDKYEYYIEVEPNVKEIVINATAISKYARIVGTGTKKIENNENVFNIDVTSETGVKKTYKLNVSIIDNDPIKINIDNREYIILKNNNSIKEPTNSIRSNITINNYDIPSFKIENLNLDIINVKDTDNNIYYVIYKDNKYELYNENKSDLLLLYISYKDLDNYAPQEIIINENKYKGFKYDDRFYIIYAMNLNTGEYNYYKYDSIDNTYMLFNEINNNEKNINYSFIALVIINVILVILLVIKRKK